MLPCWRYLREVRDLGATFAGSTFEEVGAFVLPVPVAGVAARVGATAGVVARGAAGVVALGEAGVVAADDGAVAGALAGAVGGRKSPGTFSILLLSKTGAFVADLRVNAPPLEGTPR